MGVLFGWTAMWLELLLNREASLIDPHGEESAKGEDAMSLDPDG